MLTPYRTVGWTVLTPCRSKAELCAYPMKIWGWLCAYCGVNCAYPMQIRGWTVCLPHADTRVTVCLHHADLRVTVCLPHADLRVNCVLIPCRSEGELCAYPVQSSGVNCVLTPCRSEGELCAYLMQIWGWTVCLTHADLRVNCVLTPCRAGGELCAYTMQSCGWTVCLPRAELWVNCVLNPCRAVGELCAYPMQSCGRTVCLPHAELWVNWVLTACRAVSELCAYPMHSCGWTVCLPHAEQPRGQAWGCRRHVCPSGSNAAPAAGGWWRSPGAAASPGDQAGRWESPPDPPCPQGSAPAAQTRRTCSSHRQVNTHLTHWSCTCLVLRLSLSHSCVMADHSLSGEGILHPHLCISSHSTVWLWLVIWHLMSSQLCRLY